MKSRLVDPNPRIARRTLIGGLGALAVTGPATAAALRAAASTHARSDAAGAQTSPDVATQSSGPMTSLIYRKPDAALAGMTAAGAAGVNAAWVRGKSPQWFIEEQRGGEVAAIGGIVTFDPRVVEGALRIFDWGFARQTADGSFAGTGDPFHSTSFFVAAAAHAALFARAAAQSGRAPLSARYLPRLARYTPLLLRAARWMATPAAWSTGLAMNAPFTHRRYLVGAALGLTAVLTGDRALIERVVPVIEDGLARQQPDGVNPEIGGHDSNYQMTGVVFAQYWVMYLPDHPLTPRMRAMLERALAWEASRVRQSGEVSRQGNTRTAGQERARDGVIKGIAYSRVIRGFATWAALTGDPKWAELAWRAGRYYYATPSLTARPLLP